MTRTEERKSPLQDPLFSEKPSGAISEDHYFSRKVKEEKNQAGAVCTLSPPSPTTGKTVIIRSLVQNDNAPSHFLSKKNDKKRIISQNQ